MLARVGHVTLQAALMCPQLLAKVLLQRMMWWADARASCQWSPKMCSMTSSQVSLKGVQHEVTLTSSRATGCSRSQTRPRQHMSSKVPPFGLQGSRGSQQC